MNNPRDELEAELARLRPSPPSERLSSQVKQRLEAGAGKSALLPFPGLGRRRWLLPAAAAAALVFLAALFPSLGPRQDAPPNATDSAPSSAPPQTSGIRPAANRAGLRQISAANYLVDAEDVGLMYTAASSPLRKVRYQVLSLRQWRDDADNSTIELFVPREETVLIPVDAH